MQTYYNTTSLNQNDLKQAVMNAQKQDEAIMLIYDTGKAFSPSKIWEAFDKVGKGWPITSVRRSISNLEDRGLLEKTGEMVTGIYGKRENKWIKKQEYFDFKHYPGFETGRVENKKK